MHPIEFSCGGKAIGRECQVFIIAEACDNHFGSMPLAKEMILQAKIAGADAVKFQHHLPDVEMLPDVPMSDNFKEPLYEFLKKNALTLAQHQELCNFCKNVGIAYMCTPFSHKAAEELEEHSLGDVFKIGSGEFQDFPSLEIIASIGRPMILSCGMSTQEEIEETVSFMRDLSVPFALLNCTSEYPPKYENMRLGNIPYLLETYPDLVIGHSDHTPDNYTVYAAVALGAKIIEKHVILDKRMPGPDQPVSIDMGDLRAMVDGIRKIEKSLTCEKKVTADEEKIREWAYRSVVTQNPIKRGSIIKREDLTTKRPGYGIPAKKIDSVIGRKAFRDIARNEMVRWSDFE
jgi:N-acetylneuraminate synthase